MATLLPPTVLWWASGGGKGYFFASGRCLFGVLCAKLFSFLEQKYLVNIRGVYRTKGRSSHIIFSLVPFYSNRFRVNDFD